MQHVSHRASDEHMMSELAKASKESVHYRKGTLDQHCGNCRKFIPPDGCVGVRGKISPDDACDRWAAA